MAAVTICSDFGAQENKVCHYFHCFPSICHEVMGPDAMIFIFWMLSFKPTISLSSFTFIKRLFSSSSLSAIRVVSSVYLRLLIFLPVVLIPACASSSPAFLKMCSAYKLNKQGDNIQPWRTPFPIWNQSVNSPQKHGDLPFTWERIQNICLKEAQWAIRKYIQNNPVKLRKQYTNKMRHLTEIEIIHTHKKRV